MSQKKNSNPFEIYQKLEALTEKTPPFKLEAFSFVMAGLNFTVGRLKKHRHVTGQELSEGVKDFALKEFGPLAQTVLEYWGIKSTYDIGRVVFALIDAELLNKNDEDSLEDFNEVYDFNASLRQDYWKELRNKFKFEPILRTKKQTEDLF